MSGNFGSFMHIRRHPLGAIGQFAATTLRPLTQIDWARWLRVIERKRRLLTRPNKSKSKSKLKSPPREFFARATYASFRLEGILIDQVEVADSLTNGSPRTGIRSRSSQRVRNHVAILHRIKQAIKKGESLKSQTVIRWYTSISCGLSLMGLDESRLTHLDNVIGRINSPQLRLQPAITEIAHLHAQLMAEPLVPSFNGILSRLLLQYHLGRCGLPPVVFDSVADANVLRDEPKLLRRILEMVDGGYQMLVENGSR